MIFYNEKTPFYAVKRRSSKSGIIDIFRKGLTHSFGPKMAIFPAFFLGIIGQENVFYDILERKNVFLGYKKKKFKKSKNWHFQGVSPWFWFKNGHFSNFFFRQYRPGNFFYDVLERKDVFLEYKYQKLKKLKNWYFSKGVNPWFWSENCHFPHFFYAL